MQSYDEIIRIIKSLPSVKGVRVEVRMALFGVEWAASQEKATCVGVVDRWKTKDEMLMIKWDGWNQNKQCSLTALEKDSDGDSLELKLLPYDDGRPAPTLVLESDNDDDDEVPATHQEDSEDEDFEVTTKNPVKPLGISSQTSLATRRCVGPSPRIDAVANEVSPAPKALLIVDMWCLRALGHARSSSAMLPARRIRR